MRSLLDGSAERRLQQLRLFVRQMRMLSATCGSGSGHQTSEGVHYRRTFCDARSQTELTKSARGEGRQSGGAWIGKVASALRSNSRQDEARELGELKSFPIAN
jgi:hypothetical protein